MLSKDYLVYWTAGFKICNTVGCIPYQYDKKTGLAKLLTTKTSRNIYTCSVFIHVFYIAAMGLHLALNSGKMSLANCLKGLVVTGVYAACGVSRLNFWVFETEGLKLMNWFLKFEKQLLQEYPKVDTKGSKLTKTVFFIGTFSCITFPFLIFILLIADPCTPPYSCSMMPACLNGKPEELHLAIRIPLLLFDSCMWFHVGNPGTLIIGNIFYGLSKCLQKYIAILTSLANERRSSDGRMQKLFHQYRCLQLLENQFNVTCRNLFLPGLLMVASNTLICSLYVCIKLHDVIPMPGFGFFPMVLVDAYMIIAIEVAAAGFVYNQSKCLVQDWQKLDTFGRKSANKASTTALAPLKIRFGMNFLDELSAFTILDYCANQTASLLLMSE